MRILHLMPYSPLPSDFGGAIRSYHMLKSLALSNEVDLIAFGTDEDKKILQDHFGSLLKDIHIVPGSWVKRFRRLTQFYALLSGQTFFSIVTWSDMMQKMINTVLERRAFDVVQAEFPVMARYVVDCGAIRVLDAHNVEYDNFRRMALHSGSRLRQIHYSQEYRKMLAEEIAVCRRQNVILCTSERDKGILDQDVPEVPKAVIPNGVDMEYFTPSDIVPEPHSLVFTGAMKYMPNYDGALYFLDTILPLILEHVPDTKVYIVGNSPPAALKARASDNVMVTGYVDDVRPYVWRSSVYVVPLRMGGGTRLKVLEAMAMRKPIVTTSIGCEGIDVVDRESILIADDPQYFAQRVIELFADQELRHRLIATGFELARSQYDWCVIRQKIDEIYESLARSRNQGDMLQQHECAA